MASVVFGNFFFAIPHATVVVGRLTRQNAAILWLTVLGDHPAT